MALKYRVKDLRPEAEDSFDVLVDSARSPEDAVRTALGLEVVRSGAKANLVAQVHWERLGLADHRIDLYLKPR
ncbi:MAG TPA: hypothetical protein VIL30_13290 [Ramlibacter sp.]|jgi:hypothetical protein